MATDNFNRADGPLGANWTQLVGGQNLIVAGNACGSDTAGSYATAYWNADTFASDQYSQALITVNGAIGCMVRAQVGQDRQYYMCFTQFGTLWLSRQNSSTRTDLVSVSDPFGNGDTIRLEAEGTTLRVKRNGVTVLTTTDATYSGGKPGLHIHFGTACRMDNWEGASLTNFQDGAGSVAASFAVNGISETNLVGSVSAAFTVSGVGNALISAMGNVSSQFVVDGITLNANDAAGSVAASFAVSGVSAIANSAVGTISAAFAAQGTGNALRSTVGSVSCVFNVVGLGTNPDGVGMVACEFQVNGVASPLGGHYWISESAAGDGWVEEAEL